MKAYKASSEHYDTHEIVFAESASKARSYAFGLPGLDGLEFIEIKIHRCKEFDGFYDGSYYINMSNKDVLRVYRDLGYWLDENFKTCDCCELYEYNKLPESFLTKLEDQMVCQSCQDV